MLRQKATRGVEYTSGTPKKYKSSEMLPNVCGCTWVKNRMAKEKTVRDAADSAQWPLFRDLFTSKN
jgi:hypothetical protein